MQNIERFIARLNLSETAEFKLLSIHEQPTPIICDKPVLELYHAIRDRDYEDIFEKIKSKGFISGLYGNKGSGVYMANHGRYSYDWGCNDYGVRNVIVCNVEYDSNSCFRYRSEITSNNFNSEYKITNVKTIHPKYFITYKVENPIRRGNVYVNHGQFGCDKCDPLTTRCDCLLDGYDEFDSI